MSDIKMEQVQIVSNVVERLSITNRDQVIVVGPDGVRILETPKFGEVSVTLHDGRATYVDSRKREKL